MGYTKVRDTGGLSGVAVFLILLVVIVGLASIAVPCLEKSAVEREARYAAEVERTGYQNLGAGGSLIVVKGHDYIVSHGFWENTWTHSESCACKAKEIE